MLRVTSGSDLGLLPGRVAAKMSAMEAMALTQSLSESWFARIRLSVSFGTSARLIPEAVPSFAAAIPSPDPEGSG